MTLKDAKIGQSFAVVLITGIVFIGMMLAMVPAYILHGWVISLIWGWFVVPIFHVPEINIATAIGFEMLVIMLRPIQQANDDGKNKWAKFFGYAYVAPLLILLIAYCAHLFT